MRAGNTRHDSMETSKRLLGMALQNALPPPEQDVYTKQWHSPSFCIALRLLSMKRRYRRQSDQRGVSWTFPVALCARAGLCERIVPMHSRFWERRSGLTTETLADQVTNVLCPACGAYFPDKAFVLCEPTGQEKDLR